MDPEAIDLGIVKSEIVALEPDEASVRAMTCASAPPASRLRTQPGAV
jgi:hypothetical protein